MRKDEAKKLAEMNAAFTAIFLLDRMDDLNEVIEHLEENCDTGDSNVVMSRLRGYQQLITAEALLLRKLISAHNLEKGKEQPQ